MLHDLARQAAALSWFHSIDLGCGIITSGVKGRDTLTAEAELAFLYPVAGQSVLDVGAWDGFFSFEARRRGATRVLATDEFCWGGAGWGTKAGFDLAKTSLGSDVEEREIDVASISVDTVGTFDVVLFLGVLYHLRDPLEAIQRLSRIAERLLVLETHLDGQDIPRPAMIFYPSGEQDGDPTTWWGPTPACVIGLLSAAGFGRVEFRANPRCKKRGWFYAFKD